MNKDRERSFPKWPLHILSFKCFFFPLLSSALSLPLPQLGAILYLSQPTHKAPQHERVSHDGERKPTEQMLTGWLEQHWRQCLLFNSWTIICNFSINWNHILTVRQGGGEYACTTLCTWQQGISGLRYHYSIWMEDSGLSLSCRLLHKVREKKKSISI